MSGADQTGMAVQERRKTRHLKFILVTEPNIFEHAFREKKTFAIVSALWPDSRRLQSVNLSVSWGGLARIFSIRSRMAPAEAVFRSL